MKEVHEAANIIFGATIDETLGDMVKITVIATGFDVTTGQAIPAQQMAARPQPIPVAQQPQMQTRQAQFPQSTMRPAAPPSMREQQQAAQVHHHHAEAAVPSYRRPPPSRDSQSQIPVSSTREAFRSAMPELDADWDVPAFQRRGGI